LLGIGKKKAKEMLKKRDVKEVNFKKNFDNKNAADDEEKKQEGLKPSLNNTPVTLEEHANQNQLGAIFRQPILPPRRILGIETMQKYKLLARLHSRYLRERDMASLQVLEAIAPQDKSDDEITEAEDETMVKRTRLIPSKDLDPRVAQLLQQI
jgi:hypothetical protein